MFALFQEVNIGPIYDREWEGDYMKNILKYSFQKHLWVQQAY